jgi:hypothetical protein
VLKNSIEVRTCLTDFSHEACAGKTNATRCFFNYYKKVLNNVKCFQSWAKETSEAASFSFSLESVLERCMRCVFLWAKVFFTKQTRSLSVLQRYTSKNKLQNASNNPFV